MEIIEIAKKIEEKIQEITVARSLLKKRAEDKAEKMSYYEKELAKAIIGLKNGEEFAIEGKHIINPVNTLIEKIARGVCWEEKLNADLAETLYKNNIIALNTLMAQLNGLQSINKYLQDL